MFSCVCVYVCFKVIQGFVGVCLQCLVMFTETFCSMDFKVKQ